jgi:hypothetical protein
VVTRNLWPRGVLAILGAGLLLVSALGVAAPGSGEPAAPPPAGLPSGSSVQQGPAPDLVILYAGEVMGWTEPCG